MNGGELVSHAPGEVVTHPVAAPFRSLKASRSFLKTQPVRRTVPETGLAHPRFLAGERERLLFARNQFVEHSRLIPWPGQVAGSPSRGRERERDKERDYQEERKRDRVNPAINASTQSLPCTYIGQDAIP